MRSSAPAAVRFAFRRLFATSGRRGASLAWRWTPCSRTWRRRTRRRRSCGCESGGARAWAAVAGEPYGLTRCAALRRGRLRRRRCLTCRRSTACPVCPSSFFSRRGAQGAGRSSALQRAEARADVACGAQGGAVVDRLEGADAAALSAKTAALCGAARAPPPPAAPQVCPCALCACHTRTPLTRATQPDINARLAALVHSAPVMLFMKGAPHLQRA